MVQIKLLKLSQKSIEKKLGVLYGGKGIPEGNSTVMP